MESKQLKLAIISASVRKERRTPMVANAIVNLTAEFDLDCILIDLKDVNFQMLMVEEEEAKGNLEDAKNHIRNCDAIIMVSPEYNGSYTAALKAFVDNLETKAFEGKPIGVCSVSSGPGAGMRAAIKLQQLALGLWGFPHYKMLTVSNVNDHFDEKGVLSSEQLVSQIRTYLSYFLTFANKLST